jgi:hypothetical protein
MHNLWLMLEQRGELAEAKTWRWRLRAAEDGHPGAN